MTATMGTSPVLTVGEEVVALRAALNRHIAACWRNGEDPALQPVNLLFLDRMLDAMERIVESLPPQTGV